MDNDIRTFYIEDSYDHRKRVAIDSGWTPEVTIVFQTNGGQSVSLTEQDWEQLKTRCEAALAYCRSQKEKK